MDGWSGHPLESVESGLELANANSAVSVDVERGEEVLDVIFTVVSAQSAVQSQQEGLSLLDREVTVTAGVSRGESGLDIGRVGARGTTADRSASDRVESAGSRVAGRREAFLKRY